MENGKLAPITTAEEAADNGERFLKKYYFFAQLQKAVREDGHWTVEFDVGVVSPQLIRIIIDAETAQIMDYRKL